MTEESRPRRSHLSRAATARLVWRVRRSDRDPAGAEAALAELVAANEGLVIAVAKRYHHRATHLVEWPDIVQAARAGMLRAARHFEPRRGYAFSTMATVAMQREIERTLDNQARSVRIPVSSSKRLRRIRGAEVAIAGETGRKPTIDEIASRAGLDAEAVQYVLVNYDAGPPLRLDDPDHENTVGVQDALDDGGQGAARAVIEQAMRDRLDSLSAEIVRSRFGLDGGPARSIPEIAAAVGMKAGTVREAVIRALKVLAYDPRVRALRDGKEIDDDVVDWT